MTNGGVIGKDNRPSVYSAAGVWDVNEAYHARLSRNWPGEVLVDVGSFAKNNGTGAQTVNLTTGKTWIPKCIIFFTAGSNAASGTWDDYIGQCIGFTAGASNSYAVSGSSVDNLATSNTARRMVAKCITFVHEDATNERAEASLTSFNAGGFTINWDSNTAGAAWQSNIIGYIALGGDIQAEVLNWQTPTATGNKVVNIGTFQSDLVFHVGYMAGAAPPVSIAGMNFTFGAMNSTGEQWSVAVVAEDALATSNTNRWQRTDSCYAGMTVAGATYERASFVSMDANGFTVNFAQVGATSTQVASLCIKGVKSKLAAFNKTGAAAPVTQSITAPGWRPTGVLMAYDQDTTNASPNLHAAMSLGASDGTSHRAVGFIDRDGVTPTQADAIWRDDSVALGISLGPVVDSRSSLALTSTGFDLNWSVNNASATEILYAAIGTP